MSKYSPKVLILSLIAFTAAFAFLFGEAIVEMVKHWENDPNYSHGFIIPFVSGYLLWQQREQLGAMTPRSTWWGLVVVVFGLFLFFGGTVAQEEFFSRVGMLVALGGVIIYAFGKKIFKEISFSYFYLFFMIPLPYVIYDSVAFPLKLVISKYSVATMKLIGIPVLREGNIIHLTNTTLEVADACSGIRSIISLLALAAALAYFTQDGWIRRTVLILMAFPIAILSNSFRVIGTGILASQFGPQVAEGFFHEFAGLVIFAVALIGLVAVAAILKRFGAAKHV